MYDGGDFFGEKVKLPGLKIYCVPVRWQASFFVYAIDGMQHNLCGSVPITENGLIMVIDRLSFKQRLIPTTA